jgi:hypothetical protein
VAADSHDQADFAPFGHEQRDALELLREHYASGSLSLDDLTRRVGIAATASTSAELREALLDLETHPSSPQASALEPHLVHNERVLWTGRPDPAKHFTKADTFAIPFSLMWGGFAIFWEAAALASGPGFFALFGLPFVAIGLYMIFGRFIYKARLKRRTLYAVTDRRVLQLVKRQRGDVLDAAFIDAISAVNRDVGADGSGSVIFGGGSGWSGQWANTGAPMFASSNMLVPLAFYDIPDAARVADLVTDLRRSAEPSALGADVSRR